MSPARPTLHSQLAAMIRRQPITGTPDMSLREAVAMMAENRVGRTGGVAA